MAHLPSTRSSDANSRRREDLFRWQVPILLGTPPYMRLLKFLLAHSHAGQARTAAEGLVQHPVFLGAFE